jgi:tetratricopeptide (TPR) repeat protein
MASPARATSRRGPLGLALLAAVILGGQFAWRAWHGRPAAVPADAVAEAARHEPAEAATRALELGRAGRHVESLPWFRRAAEGGGWAEHWNYGAALNNASLEVWSRSGVVTSATRSAIERLELVRGALAELELADRAAPDDASRARVAIARAQVLERWGFPVEALAAWRRARDLDPGSPLASRGEAECLAALRGERAGPATR